MEQSVKEQGKVRAFLTKKGITLSAKVYFVDAMGAMALGLFSTLLIGTIFGTIFDLFTDIPVKIYVVGMENVFVDFLYYIYTYAQGATGIVLGIAIAHALKAPPLVLFSSGVVGMCANALPTIIQAGDASRVVTAGPAGAFFCVLIAAEIGKLVSKQTKVDILVTPTVTIGCGVLVSMLLCPAIAWVVYWIGAFVNTATNMLPFLMGIIISVVVGIILTLPISSAAICAMIGISGLAGGAATAGCCAQMIGFAVISFRENRVGGLVAQGLGTSMLQMGNIVKNPRIWIPPTLAAAVTGPIATCLFKLECTGVSAGMGTCGVVGPIGIFTDMGFSVNSVLGVLLVCLVLPAVLAAAFDYILRRIGWIHDGDMKLSL